MDGQERARTAADGLAHRPPREPHERLPVVVAGRAVLGRELVAVEPRVEGHGRDLPECYFESALKLLFVNQGAQVDHSRCRTTVGWSIKRVSSW